MVLVWALLGWYPNAINHPQLRLQKRVYSPMTGMIFNDLAWLDGRVYCLRCTWMNVGSLAFAHVFLVAYLFFCTPGRVGEGDYTLAPQRFAD